jgi:hypothetical protein
MGRGLQYRGLGSGTRVATRPRSSGFSESLHSADRGLENESFRIQGVAMRWAAAAVTKEDMEQLLRAAQSGKVKLWIKYADDRGLESEVFEITGGASEFRLPGG